jgi:hypothetical protein
MSAYQATPIKRTRRTAAQILQLNSQILEALEADHPQSVRHVFYLMNNERLSVSVDKTDRGYAQIIDRCVKLRRSGELPYSWISDDSRYAIHTPTYTNAVDFLRAVAWTFRAHIWQDAADYCQVWAESKSIAGVIENVCEELAVSLYPSSGFSSLSFAHGSALKINEEANDRPVTVFYIGDYDPAGVLIDVALERELREHLDYGIELNFQRIAITEEQIEEYDLPTKPRKQSDPRALHIQDTVEAEAMPAGILRQLVREQIEPLIPEGAIAAAKKIEEVEINRLLQLADELDDLEIGE